MCLHLVFSNLWGRDEFALLGFFVGFFKNRIYFQRLRVKNGIIKKRKT